MNFINNWQRSIALEAGATSAALDLPDGIYQLVLSDALGAAATAWEIVRATVTGGTAALLRAQEGTADQVWPAGSVIYCSLTAGQIAEVYTKLDDHAALIAGLASRVHALETVGLPEHSVRVTAGEYVEPGLSLIGQFQQSADFGSCIPAVVTIPGVGDVPVRAVYLTLEDGQPVWFTVELVGNPSLTPLESLDVEGIGSLLLSAATIDWSESINRTAISWSGVSHDWADGVQRVVTFNFT
jgi:hypothetical protein